MATALDFLSACWLLIVEFGLHIYLVVGFDRVAPQAGLIHAKHAVAACYNH